MLTTVKSTILLFAVKLNTIFLFFLNALFVFVN